MRGGQLEGQRAAFSLHGTCAALSAPRPQLAPQGISGCPRPPGPSFSAEEGAGVGSGKPGPTSCPCRTGPGVRTPRGLLGPRPGRSSRNTKNAAGCCASARRRGPGRGEPGATGAGSERQIDRARQLRLRSERGGEGVKRAGGGAGSGRRAECGQLVGRGLRPGAVPGGGGGGGRRKGAGPEVVGR